MILNSANFVSLQFKKVPKENKKIKHFKWQWRNSKEKKTRKGKWWRESWTLHENLKLLLLLLLIIKTLFTSGLELKIYRNEMITGKDKKVTQASHSIASGLQVRILETSSPKNEKAPRKKRRKLAHLLLWI